MGSVKVKADGTRINKKTGRVISTKSSGSSPKSSFKKIDYTYNPSKETAAQYHERIGRERGDTQAYVDTMKGASRSYEEGTAKAVAVKGGRLEPTVITDSTIRDEVIPDINARIDSIAETGQYYDGVGNLHEADGTIADANIDSRQSEVDGLLDDADDDSRDIFRTLDKLRAETDSTTAGQIRAIKNQFDVREEQLREINRREELAAGTALLLGGASRYAISSIGISSGYARANVMELAALDAEERSAIAEVKAAQADRNYEIAATKLEYVEKLRQEKIDKAAQIAEELAEENKTMSERMKKQALEQEIAGLFDQGFTDAASIQEQLGEYATLAEISDTLAIIDPAADLANLSIDYRTFKAAQDAGDVPSSWSWMDYQVAVKNAGKSGPGEDLGVDLAPEDERILTGAGFSQADIKDIQRIVRDLGVDAIMESSEFTSAQKNAIKKVYNIEEQLTRERVENSVTQLQAQKALEDTYTTQELKELADKHGFSRMLTGAEKDIQRFLESDKAKELYVELLIQQYRQAGMFQE